MVDRTVRRLHLQAVSDEDARRAALRLEDALRCASLPDAGRRLLFVRRLNLGAVRADASAQAWALTLERAMSQSALRWLPGDAPQAATADAVWFRDTLHAHLALGLRLARGPAPAEWFWPRLLPALAQARDVPTALAAVMQAVAALPEAPAALPAWIAAISREGFTQPVLAAVARADVAALWRALGGAPAGQVFMPARGATGGQAFGADGATASAGAQGPSPSAQATHAARALVAHALRLAGEDRAARRVEAAGFGGALDASGGRALSVEPSNDARMAPHEAGETAQRAEPVQWAGHETAPEAATAAAAAKPAQRAADAAAPAGRPPQAVPADALLMGDAWPWAHGQRTAAGGALFLVALLERLGYAGWLASLPAPTARRCAAALWAALFTRLNLAPQDPAWALADVAAGTEALPAPGPQTLAAVESRLCPAKARRAAPWYGTTPRASGVPAADAWLTLARRWLRRRAGLGLRALVLRPAWLALTATHADLVFDLDATDLRVRRAGLDLDPGWVPWLQRVVGFHYERLPWLARP